MTARPAVSAKSHPAPSRWIFRIVSAIALLAAATTVAAGPAGAAPYPAPAVATPIDSSSWAQLLPTGGPPLARMGQSAIYDPVRRRMIVFGGFSGAYLHDTWALSLDGEPVWTELTPAGALPLPRSGHSAIYDPIRDRMIVFGGNDNALDPYMRDVWALSLSDTLAWTKLNPTGGSISPRGQHSAIYDPVRDQMIVFGGFDGYFSNGEVWGLSLSGAPVWRILSPSSQAPYYLRGHRAVYDPVSDAMIVFGGVDESHLTRNEVWALSLSSFPTWSEIVPAGARPEARAGHVMVYDSRQARILVYGGADAGEALGDAWVLYTSDPPHWVLSKPVGDEPPPRMWHSAVFSADSAWMVVFGGGSGTARFNDTWRSDWCAACDVARRSPAALRLEYAGANPFRSETGFAMGIVRSGRARLRVYDLAGRLVATLVDRQEQPGWRGARWDGRNARGVLVPSGVYLARLESGGEARVRKVVVGR